MFNNKILWIIGANSDIALSFINKYGNYFKEIVLASRDTDKISKQIEKNGLKNAKVFYIDLTDKDSIEAFMSKAPIPFGVIFFAGHLDYVESSENNSEKNITDTVLVNYLSPVIMIERISAQMQNQGQGFIALLSSAAEIRGKYSNRFYVSSKTAATTYLEGVMQKNEKHSVKTIIIKLGHVNTKMLKKIEKIRSPVFVATADNAAEFLFKCIKDQKSIVKYYRPIWKLIAITYRLFPFSIYKKLDI